MKNIFKATLLLGLASSMALTGCIDEVEPTNGVTQDQLDSSIKAGEATVYAIPANMVEFDDRFDVHVCFGYPAMMQILDRLLDEMVCAKSGTSYNQWAAFERAVLTEDHLYPQIVWTFYSKQILVCNKALATYPESIESEEGKGARAKALAYRVMIMLDAARLFEFLPNEKTSNITSAGNDILNYTIPVVTENTTEEEARNNPRVKHDDMVTFLLNDLKYAEENIEKSTFKSNLLPDLAAVYGLYARLYMWDENYAKAAEYARKAIDISKKTPLTEDAWTDTKTGFNSFGNSSWIWGMQLSDETSAVLTGICNFTSMVSPETTYGYAGVGAGAYPSVGDAFYRRVNNNDWRKSSWVPNSANLAQVSKLKLIRYSTLAEKRAFCNNFEYASVKFRPGEGNCTEYSVASATAIPLMRVEEMHFIEIEATAHSNAPEGKKMLENFMNTYRMRSGTYTCAATDPEAIIEEISFQKRVELWGEGQNFFDVKRLGYSVTRAYPKNNFYEACRFNTNGRPAWMNMPFVKIEGENNKALDGWNNPGVYGLYQPVTEFD